MIEDSNEFEKHFKAFMVGVIVVLVFYFVDLIIQPDPQVWKTIGLALLFTVFYGYTKLSLDRIYR